jgi:hypothetical protein
MDSLDPAVLNALNRAASALGDAFGTVCSIVCGAGPLPTLQFTLLLIFGAALYGLINELNTVVGRHEEHEAPPRSSEHR